MKKFFKKKKKKGKKNGMNAVEEASQKPKYGCAIEDSWKLLDYPTSRSDSEGDGLEVRVDPYKRASRETRVQIATMPLEATQYFIPTKSVTVQRWSIEVPWGVTLIGTTF